MVGVQWAHPVVNLLAIETSCRRVCEWRVQAVEVPILATKVALDDGPRALRRLATIVTQDGVALAILLLGEVGQLIVPRSIPVMICERVSQMTNVAGGSLPCARVDRLDESTVLIRRNAFKVFSDAGW